MTSKYPILALSACLLPLSGCIGTNSGNPLSWESRHEIKYGDSECIPILNEIIEHNLSHTAKFSKNLLANLEPAVHDFRYALGLYQSKFDGKIWVIPNNSNLTDLPPWAYLKGKTKTKNIFAPDNTRTEITDHFDDVRGIFEESNLAFGESYLKSEKEGIPLRSCRHEFAHMLYYTITKKLPWFRDMVFMSFLIAKKEDSFINRYSRTDHMEYFAEGVIAYLNNVPEIPVLQDNFESYVTRMELEAMDPKLLSIVNRAFKLSKSFYMLNKPFNPNDNSPNDKNK